MNNNQVKVIVAKPVGFCFGVMRAIALVKKHVRSLSNHCQIWTLGPLIHNQAVVNELSNLGIKVLKNISELKRKIQKEKREGHQVSHVVIIRAHGCAPQVITKIKNLGTKIIDATCPYVKRVQNVALKLRQEGYFIVVIGNKNHPEVQGILGNAKTPLGKQKNACVYWPEKQTVPKLTTTKERTLKIGVIGQTTLPLQIFQKSVNLLATGIFQELRVVNTLCQQSLLRQKRCLDLSKKSDMMFIIGDKHSANAKTLVAIAKTYCPNVWQIQKATDVRHKDIVKHLRKAVNKTVGIVAGASTPATTVNDVVRQVKNLIRRTKTDGK